MIFTWPKVRGLRSISTQSIRLNVETNWVEVNCALNLNLRFFFFWYLKLIDIGDVDLLSQLVCFVKQYSDPTTPAVLAYQSNQTNSLLDQSDSFIYLLLLLLSLICCNSVLNPIVSNRQVMRFIRKLSRLIWIQLSDLSVIVNLICICNSVDIQSWDWLDKTTYRFPFSSLNFWLPFIN